MPGRAQMRLLLSTIASITVVASVTAEQQQPRQQAPLAVEKLIQPNEHECASIPPTSGSTVTRSKSLGPAPGPVQHRHFDAEMHLVQRALTDRQIALVSVLIRAQYLDVPFFGWVNNLHRKIHEDLGDRGEKYDGCTTKRKVGTTDPRGCRGAQSAGKQRLWGAAQHGRGQDGRRWEYDGSITTLPCSENVIWSVLQTPVSIGVQQLHALMNLQSHNARAIKERRIE
ncbi:MAG: hypothetical protein BYD32DRAFT_463054 [Podila humilis]|nr:MAG: hypothetical protein BYD32DRAFT_463054 [Podila humilis]